MDCELDRIVEVMEHVDPMLVLDLKPLAVEIIKTFS
jgi:hypothetical protein